MNIADGFIIDPSKFTGDPTRLLESGIRVPNGSAESKSLINVGSSSNGLIEYTADAFGGELKGDLLVAQFNGNIGRLDLSANGTAASYSTIDGLSGLSTPLDVTTGPDGTVWVAEIGGDFIKVFAPSDVILPDDPDFDNDGILNVNDPFIRDATNGGSVVLFPGQTLLWDFDPNQDNNQPGPQGLDGYGTGLTGVMVDGNTDFEQFFQEPSTLDGQNIKLDNVKFATAAGGGATVIENVSSGDASQTSNNGEYLFHTGVTISPTVETFTVKWSTFNPGSAFTGPSQQIGGYIGTGDQSNYLKIVAIQDGSGEIQMVLEDNDVVAASSFIQADDIFNVLESDSKKIFFELTVDPTAETATPKVTYETATGSATVSGDPISLSGTNVLEAINGNYTVEGQSSDLAVGLYSSNAGQLAADTFQAVFDDIEITGTGDPSSASSVLYRVNAGGAEITATDDGPNWSADTGANASPFLIAGGGRTASFDVQSGSTVIDTTPTTIFQTERWDPSAAPEMQWAFDISTAGLYEVRLFMGNGFSGTSNPGERIFDVALEGDVLTTLDDVDLSDQFGHLVGGMISNTVEVTDGTLNIEFLNFTNNPLINGIEILQLDGDTTPQIPTVSIISGSPTVGEESGQVQVSLTTDITVPSNETVSVTFEIVPNTAMPEQDYIYSSSTASFVAETGVYTDTVVIAGSSSDATFLIDILQDELEESSEAFTVNLISVSSNAQLGVASSASITIEDDDTAPSGTNSSTVSIASPSPDAVQETGDTGVTTLEFPVSFDTPPDSAVTIEYSLDIDGSLITGLTQQIDPAGGLISVDVANDDLDNGAESVAVTLTNVTSTDDVTLGTNQAIATVTEDDTAPTTGGEVVVAINAGGPALTQGGINFISDAFFTNSKAYTDDTKGNGLQPIFDGTVYETERYGGEIGKTPFSYSIPVATGADYSVELYFAEIYQDNIGSRVFDVQVEGQLVLDDFDILAQTGGDFNQPVIVPVSGAFAPETSGAADAIDISFGASVNSAKISGIVIRSADGTVSGGGTGGGTNSSTVSIASPSPDAVQETGDTGVTTLEFPVSFDTPPDSAVTIEYSLDIDGSLITGLTQQIDPAGGLISVDVANDDLDNGAESVAVTLTNVTSTDDVTLGTNQAIATVTEDDTAPTTGGEVVVAINAGGPALTQGGINFISDAFFTNSKAYTDDTKGNGLQPIFDGTVYETERYGGEIGKTPFSYSIPVATGADYSVELYFAEIYQDNIGSRVFDVQVEGQLVLDDFDILAQTGGDFNQPVIVPVSGAFAPETSGAADAIDISFGASVNSAKISGIVIRSADGTVSGGGTGGGTNSSTGTEPSDLDIGIYDASSDTLIATIKDGDEISESSFEQGDITVAAFVPGDSLFSGQAESMSLDLNNGQATQVDDTEPYALFGDLNGDFTGGSLPLGQNTITFDIYSQDSLQGELLGIVSRTFTVINDVM